MAFNARPFASQLSSLVLDYLVIYREREDYRGDAVTCNFSFSLRLFGLENIIPKSDMGRTTDVDHVVRTHDIKIFCFSPKME